MYLGLSLTELMEVVRTCDSIDIEDCTPPYLQDFFAKRLEGDKPVLAARVRNMNAKQIGAVCEYVKITRQLIRKPQRT